MKTRSLVTVALLAFVVVAVGFLVVKEIRTPEGIASPLGTGLKADSGSKEAPLTPDASSPEGNRKVLIEIRDGRQVRWRNLEKVWTLLNSEREFIPYVQGGVSDFRKKT